MKVKTDVESTSPFRRSALAVAIGLALSVSAATVVAGGPVTPPTPGVYFTPFADGDVPADPEDLANGMLLDEGGVSVISAGFQGNTGVSAFFGGYEGEWGYFGGVDVPVPDTVLGQFPGAIAPGAPVVSLPAPIQTDDDSSPLGDGLADAFLATPTVDPVTSNKQLTLGISGYADFDFDGLDDFSQDPADPLSGAPHFEEGPYVLYLSVMDGVDDPDFSGGYFSGIDDEDFYNPAVHADLAIAAYLGDDLPLAGDGIPADGPALALFAVGPEADDVDTFSFDSGTAAAGDGAAMLEPGFLIAPPEVLSNPGDWMELGLYDGLGLPPGIGDPAAAAMVQNFLDLLDGGNDVAVVLDNDPLGGYGGYGGYTEFLGSASFVDDMNLGTGPEGEDLNFGDGILLTSGVGTPPDENTSGSFTGFASGVGDEGLNQLLDVAFQQGLIETPAQSTDATALTFDFTVPDGANAVELDFMFGTEEFPGWNYPDVALIAIDGINYAIFPDGTPTIFDPDTPIADILLDNGSGTYQIEYDGISGVRRLVAPLGDPNPDGTHTFKAAVSDARDQIYDTGLFLANFAATTVPAGTDPSDPVLPTPDFDPTDGFDFRIDLGDAGLGINPETPVWFDPDIAIGYTFEILNGPNFATLTLPSGYGDDWYEVSWWDPNANGGLGAYVVLDSGNAAQNGQWFGDDMTYIDFLSLIDAGGITAFKVLGIEVSEGLDPTDPTAFVWGATFTQGGQTVEISQTPITTFVSGSIPEPGILFLMGSGMLGLGAMRRRQRRAA